MKIRSICLMKDEVDVIGQTLQAGLGWSNQIIVLDNGSTDGSWELVQRMAADDPRIVAFGQDLRPFRDGMRANCFNAFAGDAAAGDWWCRLDADEFYGEDPRAALAQAPAEAFSVWSAGLVYYFTDADAARYEKNPADFDDDVPISERCRYYLNHTSEPRFFRHEPGLRWTEEHSGFPLTLWARPAWSRRVVVKNYRYRSPAQIQRRLEARQATSTHLFPQERVADWSGAVARLRETGGDLKGDLVDHAPTDWHQRIAPATALDFDALDGTYVIREDLMPGIPEPQSEAHINRAILRARLRGLAPTGVKQRLRSLRSPNS
ncbi:Glycosyltransferase involved in cell wall bisynthesis [Frankineae bacterium MT45]|nr:Glycosyltransferase involved in cell wall bisynthesis [Frankineae bacterium MT45]